MMTSLGRPENRIQDIHGPIRCGGKSNCLMKEYVFCMRIVKYWNTLLAAAIADPFSYAFNKSKDQVWTEVFPHFPDN